jgi:hypothetical protein
MVWIASAFVESVRAAVVIVVLVIVLDLILC